MRDINISNQQLLATGMVAAIIVGIGEYLLHFLPEGPGGEIAMLSDVPLARASVGHFLVIFGTPLYFIGYLGVKKFFAPTSKKRATIVMALGIFSFFIAGVWASSRYFAAAVFQRSMGTPDYDFYLQSYADHYQLLFPVLRLVVGILSLFYIWMIVRTKQGLPKWLAIFNPILIFSLALSTLAWAKPLGVHLAPVAIHVTHFIFFGLLIWQERKRIQRI